MHMDIGGSELMFPPGTGADLIKYIQFHDDLKSPDFVQNTSNLNHGLLQTLHSKDRLNLRIAVRAWGPTGTSTPHILSPLLISHTHTMGTLPILYFFKENC